MKITPDQINRFAAGTMAEALGIHVEIAEPDRVIATMPVGPATRQPYGVLHGGASVALAETIASVGAWLNINPDRQSVYGIEINANHIRSKRDGFVRAEARPLHLGRTTMIWHIDIRDEEGALVAVSRCTLAVVEQPSTFQGNS